MIDDDARDIAIHRRIEEMIRIFSAHRGIPRSTVIAELCNGEGKFDHGLNAIAEMFSLPRHEINERVSAFIEAEKEEEAERAFHTALSHEADA